MNNQKPADMQRACGERRGGCDGGNQSAEADRSPSGGRSKSPCMITEHDFGARPSPAAWAGEDAQAPTCRMNQARSFKPRRDRYKRRRHECAGINGCKPVRWRGDQQLYSAGGIPCRMPTGGTAHACDSHSRPTGRAGERSTRPPRGVHAGLHSRHRRDSAVGHDCDSHGNAHHPSGVRDGHCDGGMAVSVTSSRKARRLRPAGHSHSNQNTAFPPHQTPDNRLHTVEFPGRISF